jgi:hypothetical protein
MSFFLVNNLFVKAQIYSKETLSNYHSYYLSHEGSQIFGRQEFALHCCIKLLGYFYHLANVIKDGHSQSDHIKRRPLFKKLFKFKRVICDLVNLIPLTD